MRQRRESRSDHGLWLYGTGQVNLSKISNLLHFDYALTLLEEAAGHNRGKNSFNLSTRKCNEKNN